MQSQPSTTLNSQALNQAAYQVIKSNHNQIKRNHINYNTAKLIPQHASIQNVPDSFDLKLLQRTDSSADQESQQPVLARNARHGRQVNATMENGAADSKEEPSEKKHCDGYDKVGCYVVRVYYDWFLINGSCKCWKSPSSPATTINETIKKIFIGKWKQR